MFRAIGRYFTALGYLFTGRIDKARQALETDPNVIRATYDDVVREKKNRIQEFMAAVATLIRQQESKKAEKARLEDELKRHEAVMAGALAMARKRTALLQAQGKTVEEIKADPEVLKHQGAYMDVKSTSEHKRARIEALVAGIARAQEQIDKHKINLERMSREISDLKSEAGDAVARVISAQEEKALADMLSGLSNSDRTGERLASVRDVVSQVEAEARVSSELAGTDAAVTESEYLAHAVESQAADEFSQLLGLSEAVDSGNGSAKVAPKRERAGGASKLS